MDITIKINAPELSAAISALAYAIDEFNRNNKGADKVTAPNNPAVAAVTETAQEETKAPTTTEEKPAETKPAITFEQVRARLAPISQSGKQAQLKELLSKFGASKLSDVAPDKYESFLAAVEGL